MLLCHAEAVKLYREKYQATQKGQIGIALVSHWMIPYSSSKLDIIARQRALDFMYGWSIHPLIYGDYPASMRKTVTNRLPKFTPKQSEMVKGSFDFLGLNYYTAKYAQNDASQNNINVSSFTDPHALLTSERNGKSLGEPSGFSGFYVYPKGLRDLLDYTKKNYKNPPIYITENGYGDANNSTLIKGIKDVKRVDFFHRHLLAVQEAIKLGVNVKGFFAWSFLDTFEWRSGYTARFGLCYVDYKDGLKRYPKSSALWFKKFLRK